MDKRVKTSLTNGIVSRIGGSGVMDIGKKPAVTPTDKLCLAALAGVFLTANLSVWALDCVAYRSAGPVAEVDKPPAAVVVTAVPMDGTRILAAGAIPI